MRRRESCTTRRSHDPSAVWGEILSGRQTTRSWLWFLPLPIHEVDARAGRTGKSSGPHLPGHRVANPKRIAFERINTLRCFAGKIAFRADDVYLFWIRGWVHCVSAVEENLSALFRFVS